MNAQQAIVGSFFGKAGSASRLTRGAEHLHTHPHSHDDYVRTHPHSHDPEAHPHAPGQTPLGWLDRHLRGLRAYHLVRPLVVGVVHGLAGSAAIALLVLATVRALALWYLPVSGSGRSWG